MKTGYNQSTFREVLNAFVISGLVALNVTLIVIAAVWYLLVFSIFHPVEVIQMYTFQTPNVQMIEEAEYTLEIVNRPPPPLVESK